MGFWAFGVLGFWGSGVLGFRVLGPFIFVQSSIVELFLCIVEVRHTDKSNPMFHLGSFFVRPNAKLNPATALKTPPLKQLLKQPLKHPLKHPPQTPPQTPLLKTPQNPKNPQTPQNPEP